MLMRLRNLAWRIVRVMRTHMSTVTANNQEHDH